MVIKEKKDLEGVKENLQRRFCPQIDPFFFINSLENTLKETSRFSGRYKRFISQLGVNCFSVESKTIITK